MIENLIKRAAQKEQILAKKRNFTRFKKIWAVMATTPQSIESTSRMKWT